MNPSRLAWSLSLLFCAVLTLAVSTTLYGNRGDDQPAGWTGGGAPLLAWAAGLLPMLLGHSAGFVWLRPRDALPVRMAYAAFAGMLGFGLGLAALALLARHG